MTMIVVVVILPLLKLFGFHLFSLSITFVKFHRYSFTAEDGVSKPIKKRYILYCIDMKK